MTARHAAFLAVLILAARTKRVEFHRTYLPTLPLRRGPAGPAGPQGPTGALGAPGRPGRDATASLPDYYQ